jgi:molybdate transport system substrate-binding protein
MVEPSEFISGISSMAVRELLRELADMYARAAGLRVELVSVGGIDAARRVDAGEPFDFVVLAADAIAKLVDRGRVDAQSVVDVVRSAIAVAVRKGAPRPDISTESALRDAVQRARTVGYSTGPSGKYLLGLFTRWGIAGDIAERLREAPPGVPVASFVERGDAEIGFQQLSELLDAPGIEVIGPLPAAVQSMTTFAAGLCTISAKPDVTRAFLSSLASPRTAQAKRRHGMDPARR